jgi:hypothetical protein
MTFVPPLYDARTRIFNVGQNPGMHPSIQGALDAISVLSPAPNGNNRVIILVWPGRYVSSASLVIPSCVGVKGISKGVVQLQNNTTNLFTIGGSSTWFEDFIVEGSSTAGLYAFEGNNKNAIHIRNVDMLSSGGTARQLFLHQSGSGWSVMFLEHIVVDGWQASGYCCVFENTGSPRFVDTTINDVFFDSWHLNSLGGNFRLVNVQDLRISRSTIRTGTNGRSISHERTSGTPDIQLWQNEWGVYQPSLVNGTPIYTEAGTTCTIVGPVPPGSTFNGTYEAYGAGDGEVGSQGPPGAAAVTPSDILLASDQTTSSAGYSTLVSGSVAVGATDIVTVSAVINIAGLTATQVFCKLQVDTVDVPYATGGVYLTGPYVGSVPVNAKITGLSAGPHTFEILWRTTASQIWCRPASYPGTENAKIIVQAVTPVA